MLVRTPAPLLAIVGTGLGIDQLHIDLNLFAQPAHAAFEDIAYPKLAADLFGIKGFALIGEGGVAGDDKTVVYPGEIGGHIVGDAIGKVFLFGITRQVGERQDDDREAGCRWPRGWLDLYCAGDRRQDRHVSRAHGIGPNRPREVLDGLLAKVFE
jgi:hypothetical protein